EAVELLCRNGEYETYTPQRLKLGRGEVGPSNLLLGFVRIARDDWVTSEVAVKPGEETVYVLDGRRDLVRGGVLVRREAPEPEQMTYPSIYHYLLYTHAASSF